MCCWRRWAMASSLPSRDEWSFDQLPDLLRPEHLMMVLGVSDTTLYELNHSLLKGVARKVGRQWRYPKAGLRRLLEGDEVSQ
jgi:hypothetical protein